MELNETAFYIITCIFESKLLISIEESFKDAIPNENVQNLILFIIICIIITLGCTLQRDERRRINSIKNIQPFIESKTI